MAINYTVYAIDNLTSYTQVVGVANTFSSGFMGEFFILGFFFVIMLVTSRQKDTKLSMLYASFVAMVTSILLFFAGIENWITTSLAITFWVGCLLLYRGASGN